MSVQMLNWTESRRWGRVSLCVTVCLTTVCVTVCAATAPNNGQEARVAGQVIALAGLPQEGVRPHREPIGRVRGAVGAQHRHGLHGRPLPSHLVGRNPVVHDDEANPVQLLHERVCVDLTPGPWWRCNGSSSSSRLARHLSPRVV